MMGARQLAGQADTHLAVYANDATVTREPQPNGHTIERYRLTLEWPKSREGAGQRDMALSLDSETDAKGRKLWLALNVIGECPAGWGRRDRPPRAVIGQRILAALADRPMTRADLARAVGTERNNGTFGRAVKALLGAGDLIELDGRRLAPA